MSIRTIAGTTAVAALLAVPGSASARLADPVGTHPYVGPRASAPVATEATGTAHHGGGSGTLTVLAIAGGTLLAGAATGFGGGRVITRQRAVRS